MYPIYIYIFCVWSLYFFFRLRLFGILFQSKKDFPRRYFSVFMLVIMICCFPFFFPWSCCYVCAYDLFFLFLMLVIMFLEKRLFFYVFYRIFLDCLLSFFWCLLQILFVFSGFWILFENWGFDLDWFDQLSCFLRDILDFKICDWLFC